MPQPLPISPIRPPAIVALTALLGSGAAVASVAAQPTGNRPASPPIDWREAEADTLANHVRLTFETDFHKAGEAYFSPDGQWIVFQAVPAPGDEEEAPDPFYSMYIAELRFEDDRVVGLNRPIRISPPDSANTCGWFHPIELGTVIFGSTLSAPSPSDPPGFQRESSRYVWMFPPETEIVQAKLRDVMAASTDERPRSIDGDRLNPLTDNSTYDAECAYSPDGRHIVYTSFEPEPAAGEIYVLDTRSGRSRRIVEAPGYDGGPFFSPDGRRIAYRSDRDGTNLLQIFVADLEFDDDGAITGVAREHQVTDNEHVNWCPYWHPGGRHLVYATSELGHHNYEVFLTTADPGDAEGSSGPLRYGLQNRRVTHAGGFDGLPAFSPDGRLMMWTSQRTDDPAARGSSQLWIADFVMELDPERAAPSREGHR